MPAEAATATVLPMPGVPHAGTARARRPELGPPPDVAGGGVMTLQPEGLLAFLPDLERLAASAAEANPFYEVAFLDAALRNLRGDARVELALVFTPDANPQRPARLTGLFPVETTRMLGVQGFRLWRHRHCYLTAPLVDASVADDVLERFFTWAQARAAFVEMRMWPAEGALHHAFVRATRKREAMVAVREHWLRAALKPEATADACIEKISGRSRKEHRRLEKLLREQHGEIAFASLSRVEDPEPWLDEFMALEASGWKGSEGSALASREEDRAFFLDAARSAHRAGRLEMIRVTAGGKTIASKCNVRTAAGPSAAFKIAFDESFAKFSPGVLLELENIRSLHRPHAAPFMDSCASPDHPMIDRLWSGRRLLQSIVVSTGSLAGDAVIAALPAVELVKRVARRFRRTTK